MFSLACNLTKNNFEFLPVEILSKNVHASNVDFLTIKITWNKASENNMYFLTREITSKKVDGKNVDILTSEITLKKVRGNKCIFEPSKLYQKKFVKTTWTFRSAKLYRKSTRKWRENSSKLGFRRIEVISTWNRCYSTWCPHWLYLSSKLTIDFYWCYNHQSAQWNIAHITTGAHLAGVPGVQSPAHFRYSPNCALKFLNQFRRNALKNQFKKRKNPSKWYSNSILLKFFDATVRRSVVPTSKMNLFSLTFT